jgi:hypothetical protein
MKQWIMQTISKVWMKDENRESSFEL